ncbi:MAG: hypothetical protein ABIN13_10120 [Mucilaginibacter sp.]
MTKRFKPLFFAFLTVGLFTFQSPATANGYNGPGDEGKTGNKAAENSAADTLPVNNNIVFLIIVGVAIGGKIITDKIKSARQ